jgi:hypothetical protein
MIKNFTISKENIDTLCNNIKSLDPTITWVANVTPKKSKRSLDQNALYWECLQQAEKESNFGYTADELHELMGYKFLRYEKNNHKFIKSTAKLNTKEFAEYFENVLRFFSEHNFRFESIND